MEAVERLAALLDRAAELLDRPGLCPDATRRDWSEAHPLCNELARLVDGELLPALETALYGADPETQTALRASVAAVGLETIAVLSASGTGDSLTLLSRIRGIAPRGPLSDEAAAASRDLDAYARLASARWLLRHGRNREARPLLTRVVKESRDPVLRRLAKEGLRAPKPIGSPPPLFTFNGFGVRLFGSRDRRPDGSEIKTYGLCALYIPILPFAAYRVIDHGDGSYGFMSKNPLGGLARGYLALLALAVVTLISWTVIDGHLSSPERLSRLALADAQAIEERGDPAAALAAYEDLLDRFGDDGGAETVARAGEALTRLLIAQTPDPLPLDEVERAARVQRRYLMLPARARSDRAGALLADRLESFAAQVAEAGRAGARAEIRLLELAAGVAPAARRDELAARRGGRIAALAAALAPERPLAALDLYLEAPDDPGARSAAGDVLVALGDRVSLWIEAAPRAEDWLRLATDDPALAAGASAIAARLEEARAVAADADRRQLLETGDEAALAALLSARPGDQHAAVALAARRLGRGELGPAEEILAGLGSPGWLIAEAQEALAEIYADSGRLEDADRLLEELVAERLPRFQKASDAYNRAAGERQEALIHQAQVGMPADLEARLMRATESEQPEIFHRWLGEQLDADPELARLREAYVSQAGLVSASLSLGMIKLRRASAAHGDERDALLAGAERTFLAIRSDAEGLPGYHLGLGQVYHRLGKDDEGDREFQGLLDRGDPELALAVAHSYRELALIPRAREIAEGIWEGSPAPHREEAAVLMSLMADDHEATELWLGRADQSSPDVRTRLVQVRAERALIAGRFAEADRQFAEVVAFYERDAAHSSAAANNAAVGYMNRYRATGDARHLAAAAQHLEAALRLMPDSALIIGNLAGLYELQGMVEVLGRWTRTEVLRLSNQTAETLLSVIGGGPLAEEVAAATRAPRAVQRVLALTDREIVLRPRASHAYDRLARWYSLRRDTERLRALHGRLVHGGVEVDTDLIAERRQELSDRSRDAELLGYANDELEGQAQMLELARRSNHPRTLAAAEVMRAQALVLRAHLADDVESAREAVEGLRRAARTWPELAELRLAYTLLFAAVLEARLGSPELEALWQAEGRIYNAAIVLHRAVGSGEGDAAVAAVRARPEIAEATRLLRRQSSDRLPPWAYLVAQVAGDAELERAAQAALAREDARLRAEIDQAIDPSSPERAYMAALYQ